MRFLKESNTLFGFIISFILSVIAIYLAAIDNSYWVTVLVVSQILLWLSVYKADQYYKGRS